VVKRGSDQNFTLATQATASTAWWPSFASRTYGHFHAVPSPVYQKLGDVAFTPSAAVSAVLADREQRLDGLSGEIH
jgi:hypothetical protein